MAITNCIDTNFIGIRGCTGSTPDSRLYINDLPGISLKLAANVTNEEWTTGTRLLQGLESEAIKLTSNDFRNALSSHFDYHSVIDSAKIGVHDDDYEAATFAGEKGYTLELLTNDRFVELYVEKLEFVSHEAVSTNVYIVDGTTTTTTAFSVVKGKNSLRLDYVAQNKEVTVTMDLSGFTILPVTTSASQNSACGTCECVSDCKCFRVTPVNRVATVITTQANTRGVVVFAQCRCSTCELVSIFKEQLAYAIRFRMGGLLMQEVMTTDRANPLARNSKDSAHELYVQWMGGTNKFTGFSTKGEYYNELQNVVKAAKVALSRQKSKCLACTGVKAVTALP